MNRRAPGPRKPEPVAEIMALVRRLDDENLERLLHALEPERQRLAEQDEEDNRAAHEALVEMARTGEKPIPWDEVKASLRRR